MNFVARLNLSVLGWALLRFWATRPADDKDYVIFLVGAACILTASIWRKRR